MTSTGKRRLILAAATALVLAAAGCTGDRHPDPGEIGAATATGEPTPTVTPTVATIDTLLAQRPLYGIALPQTTTATLAAVTAAAGCRPSVVNRFVSVADGLSTRTLTDTPGLPMLSLEPWHAAEGPLQPDFTLRATIDGHWDNQYRAIAQAIKGYAAPVLVRFAHEMNGNWYPWAVTNGNTAAQFVQAWQHVVKLFRSLGATNVLWIWSPNILRGAASTTIKQFWPGADYVDLIGMTGYGVHESSPDLTFGPTLAQIQALSDKPVFLTEIGASADGSKTQWMSAFGAWLVQHPQLLGFVWFENGTGDDWRFDDTTAHLASFKTALKQAGVKC